MICSQTSSASEITTSDQLSLLSVGDLSVRLVCKWNNLRTIEAWKRIFSSAYESNWSNTTQVRWVACSHSLCDNMSIHFTTLPNQKQNKPIKFKIKQSRRFLLAKVSIDSPRVLSYRGGVCALADGLTALVWIRWWLRFVFLIFLMRLTYSVSSRVWSHSHQALVCPSQTKHTHKPTLCYHLPIPRLNHFITCYRILLSQKSQTQTSVECWTVLILLLPPFETTINTR